MPSNGPHAAPAADPLRETVEQIDRAVDAVSLTAMAIARTIGLDSHDVPRRCVAAGLRSLEKVIDTYNRRLALEEAGQQAFQEDEKLILQRQTLTAANDVLNVMAEATTMAQRILESLGVKPH